jgi:2-oxoglutarate dehydrogenase E1 component
MVRSFRKPLILMTPKSLLRQKRCRSSLTELSGESRFQQILRDDGETSGTIVPDESVRKVLLCSGKIYYDLESERAKRGLNDIYILRIEQLYPFPAKSLASELARFSGARTAWCQEEPRNMGAWSFVEPYLEHAAAQYQGMSRRPEYIGRAASAATATGLLSQHFKELQAIMDQAFTLS